jgi:signal transduction histidine kinase
VQAEVGKDRVCVRVCDTGPGMLPEDLEHCFERFHRGAGGPLRSGFGLGLPIAREIARAHGGEVEIEKSDVHGTVFRVWLPLQLEVSR